MKLRSSAMSDGSLDSTLVRELSDTLIATLRSLDDGLPYALTDFPDYSNIGDSLLWLGARRALATATGRSPSFVSNLHSHDDDELRARLPKGTIYILGGGNFGDLWPRHQQFRESIAARHHGLRIVQLPQSVSFSDPDNLARARKTIAAHGNFVLLVRDRESLRRSAALASSEPILAPDLAFCIGTRPRPGPPEVPILALLRSDMEIRRSVSDWLRDGASAVVDWNDIDTHDIALRFARPIVVRRRALGFLPMSLRVAAFDAIATRRMTLGERIVTRGSRVRTDRLHGHVICVLLGIAHDVGDNSDGKVRSFIETWTRDARSLGAVSWERHGIDSDQPDK